MYPWTHFLFPLFVGLILTKLSVFSWKLAFLAGIIGAAVDIDHYFEHIMRAKKDKFSLIKTWNVSIKTHHFNQRSFIHGWGGAILLTAAFIVAVFFNWQVTLALALGYYSHLLLDFPFVELPYTEERVRWRIGNLWFREPFFEVGLDLVLVVGSILLLVV
jgi:hypothetical protein